MLRGAPGGGCRGHPRAAGAAPPLRAREPRRPQRPGRTHHRGAWTRLHGGAEPRSSGELSSRGGGAGGGTEHPASVRDGVTHTAGQNPGTPRTPNTAGSQGSSSPAGAGRGKWRRESGDGERGKRRRKGRRRGCAGSACVGRGRVCDTVCGCDRVCVCMYVHVCMCGGVSTAGRPPVPVPSVPAHACVTPRSGGRRDPPGPAPGLGQTGVVHSLDPSPRSHNSPVGFGGMG